MLARTALVGLAALFASACSTFYPIPESEPSTRLEATDNAGRLPEAKNFAELVLNLKTYEKQYRDAANTYKTREYTASDVGVLGGLLAIFGAIDHSRSAFNVGALTGGTALGVSHRYRFEVQAQNFEAARKSMDCMLRKAQEFPVSPDDFVIQGNDALELKRAGMFIVGNKAVRDVVERLRAAQWSITLLSPDVSKLRDLSDKYAGIATPRSGTAKSASNLEAMNKSAAVASPLLREMVTHFEPHIAKCAAAAS